MYRLLGNCWPNEGCTGDLALGDLALGDEALGDEALGDEVVKGDLPVINMVTKNNNNLNPELSNAHNLNIPI